MRIGIVGKGLFSPSSGTPTKILHIHSAMARDIWHTRHKNGAFFRQVDEKTGDFVKDLTKFQEIESFR